MGQWLEKGELCLHPLAVAGGAAAKVKRERGGEREALRHRQLGFLSGTHEACIEERRVRVFFGT